ncbi:hypothetical protein [Desulfurobacterium sp.]
MEAVSREVKCAVCGYVHRQYVITSMLTCGCYLDLRPVEQIKALISYEIQRCPKCHYCALNVSEKVPNAEKVIKTKEYVEQFNCSKFPKLANFFLCYSIILKSVNDYAKAGWSCMRAAWVCEDMKEGVIYFPPKIDFDLMYTIGREDFERIREQVAGEGFDEFCDAIGKEIKKNYNPEAEQECRERAFAFFMKAKKLGQRFAKRKGVEEEVLTDILRRLGKFDKALKMAQEGLRIKGIDRDVRLALEFQIKLIKRKDTSCYTFDDASKFFDEEKF